MRLLEVKIYTLPNSKVNDAEIDGKKFLIKLPASSRRIVQFYFCIETKYCVSVIPGDLGVPTNFAGPLYWSF